MRDWLAWTPFHERRPEVKRDSLQGEAIWMTLKMKWLAAALLGAAVSASANASLVSLNGTGFSVSYDDAVKSLFGTPTLVGNLLTFSPSNFAASATGGFSFADAMFSLQVTAADGYLLNSVGLLQQGSFALLGRDATFGVASQMTVTSLDQGGAKSVGVAGQVQGADTLMGGSWSAGPADYQVSGFDSKIIDLSLDTTLFAAGGTGTFARASLNTAQLSFGIAQVPPVPEPEAYLMLLTGLGMVGVVARRRSAVR